MPQKDTVGQWQLFLGRDFFGRILSGALTNL
jgi:hypothetical protein